MLLAGSFNRTLLLTHLLSRSPSHEESKVLVSSLKWRCALDTAEGYTVWSRRLGLECFRFLYSFKQIQQQFL
jgi:hypothetical protein